MSKRRRDNPTKRELFATIARLEKRIAEQDKRIATLEAELAKALKNSSTSSKPPSSDIVKPPKAKGKKKRKQGAQPGHPKHERPPFSPDEVDETHEHTLDACPDCDGALVPGKEAPRVIQQVEVVEKPIRIEEHRGLPYWCANCEKIHYAPFPKVVKKGGLFGPGLTAQVAYMKSAGHASFSTIRKYLRDVMGLDVSRGHLNNVLRKVADALEEPYNELLALLASEPLLNVDETGHKENGDKFWTWCFRAQGYALFKIDPSRGSQVLYDVLGEDFAGVLGCDYFSAYRKFMKECDIRVQFCLAHLIRDLKYLTTLSNPLDVAYGERLLDEMRTLFGIIHRREKMGKNAFRKALCDQRKTIIRIAIRGAPDTQNARRIVKRFEKHGAAYFQFITTPGMEPTNNLAEQAIRFVVIDRLITQGTRSEAGRQWCERIWSVMATCAMQGRSAYDFLVDAVEANFQNRPAPSLLTNSS